VDFLAINDSDASMTSVLWPNLTNRIEFPMIIRSIAIFTVVTLPLFGSPIPKPKEEVPAHPYKNFKVGDYVIYELTGSENGKKFTDGIKTIHSVSEVSDNELTIQVTVSQDSGKIREKDVKIDLTKPFDPLSLNLAAGKNAQKLKDGTEKITVGKKEYDCKWTTYKVTIERKDKEPYTGEYKIWTCEGVKGLVKMTYDINMDNKKTVHLDWDRIDSGGSK
jgi:hypothetical protein